MRRSIFTLIELLVSAACKVRVLPLYLFKKTIRKMPLYAYFPEKKPTSMHGIK